MVILCVVFHIQQTVFEKCLGLLLVGLVGCASWHTGFKLTDGRDGAAILDYLLRISRNAVFKNVQMFVQVAVAVEFILAKKR